MGLSTFSAFACGASGGRAGVHSKYIKVNERLLESTQARVSFTCEYEYMYACYIQMLAAVDK